MKTQLYWRGACVVVDAGARGITVFDPKDAGAASAWSLIGDRFFMLVARNGDPHVARMACPVHDEDDVVEVLRALIEFLASPAAHARAGASGGDP